MMDGMFKNGTMKMIVNIIALLSLVAYIAVSELSKTRVVNAANGLNERVARIEECILSLRPLPQDVAGIKVAIEDLQKSLDKLEKRMETK